MPCPRNYRDGPSEHNGGVLREAGFTTAEIEQLLNLGLSSQADVGGQL